MQYALNPIQILCPFRLSNGPTFSVQTPNWTRNKMSGGVAYAQKCMWKGRMHPQRRIAAPRFSAKSHRLPKSLTLSHGNGWFLGWNATHAYLFFFTALKAFSCEDLSSTPFSIVLHFHHLLKRISPPVFEGFQTPETNRISEWPFFRRWS